MGLQTISRPLPTKSGNLIVEQLDKNHFRLGMNIVEDDSVYTQSFYINKDTLKILQEMIGEIKWQEKLK